MATIFNIITKRLTMKGLIVGDSLDRSGAFEKEIGVISEPGR